MTSDILDVTEETVFLETDGDVNALYESVEEVVVLEVPVEHEFIEAGEGDVLHESVEEVVILEVCMQGPPGVGGGGIGIFVIAAAAVGGIVGGREYVGGTAPPNTVLSRALCDADVVDITVLVEGPVSFYSPSVKIGGIQAVVTQTATTRIFTAVASVALVAGANVVWAEVEGGGRTSVLIERAEAGPSTLAVEFGPFPGAQTALKAGDVVEVAITTEQGATSVTVAAGGAAGAAVVIPVVNGAAVGFVTIGAASGSQVLYVSARNSLGTVGATFASPPVTLDQTYPTIAPIIPGYPTGQSAFGEGQAGTFAATASGFDTITYVSPNFTVDSPSSYAPVKSVVLTGTGYLGVGTNVTIAATRNNNGAVTTRNGLLKFATVAPTASISIQGSPSRLISSPSGQDYTILLQASQELLDPPLLSASIGAWQGEWTLSGGVWRRNLRITDVMARGAGLFSGLLIAGLTGLGGTSITSGTSYIVGGMSTRTITFPAFSRVAPLGASVATAAKTSARITGGAVLTRYDDSASHSNGYYIADLTGAYNPTGAYLGLSDIAFAGANTTGGLTAEFSEVA